MNVAYGDRGRFHFLYNMTGGNLACNNKTFGDPIYGIEKACYIQQASKNEGPVVSGTLF